jgi:Mlc titration factor MtfA (ptsG expression regulator)
MKTATNKKRLLAQYRYWKKKLAETEKAFDAFMRGNRDNNDAKNTYAAKANAEYFAIKARLLEIKTTYRLEATGGIACDL